MSARTEQGIPGGEDGKSTDRPTVLAGEPLARKRPKAFERTWGPVDMMVLGSMVQANRKDAEIAEALGRSLNAVRIRRQRYLPQERDLSKSPGWGKGKPGGGKYWTPERVEEGLRDFASRHKGPLPPSDHVYSGLKKGHMEWPTATAVLEQFGTMADAWAGIGASKSRFNRGWVPWTQEDDDYLLDWAGSQTLKIIAKRLGRSWPACKRRLYDLGAGRARDVAGYLSAMQVAKEYNCPLSRVKKLIASGELPAHRVQGGHYWRIDPEDCEKLRAVLSAPKTRSYRTTPPSHGDYDRRYGLRRVRVNGRIVRVAS